MSVEVLPVIIGLVAGLLLGGGYFALLHHSVRPSAAPASTGRILGLTVLRAALAVGVFWGLVQLGAWALLAGLGGFLVARHVARRLVGA